jgi:hypothetical protein
LRCYRWANYSTPLRALPSDREGRFHRPDDPPVQYLSDHPLGPWAEFLRWTPLARDQLARVAVRTWALEVDRHELVVVTFDNAHEYGIAPERLVADDYADCQDLALQLREQGATGLIAPSAALPSARNVVLFGRRVLAPWGTKPSRDHIAGAPTADHARPPVEVLALYRHKGTSHPGFEAWKRGREYVLAEPSTYEWQE